ncbi:hypothetical protein EDD17DRAFT_1509581 [Pisolithus thermaeus]|nr:hypothetical protein EDD17DRAFT_1509581 [Pisolithus thermaeus]
MSFNFFMIPNHKDMKKYKLSPMQWNILRDFKLILELTWVKKSWSTDEYKKAKQIVLQMMTQYCEQMGHNKLEVEPLPALAARLKTLTWHFGYTINSNNESSEDEPSPTVHFLGGLLLNEEDLQHDSKDILATLFSEKVLQSLGRGEEENWDLEWEDGADLQQLESDGGEIEDDNIKEVETDAEGAA